MFIAVSPLVVGGASCAAQKRRRPASGTEARQGAGEPLLWGLKRQSGGVENGARNDVPPTHGNCLNHGQRTLADLICTRSRSLSVEHRLRLPCVYGHGQLPAALSVNDRNSAQTANEFSPSAGSVLGPRVAEATLGRASTRAV